MNRTPESLDFDDSVDVRVLARRLRTGRWWILASVLLFTCAFVAAAFLMTPKYQVATVLVPAGTEHPGLGDALGGAIGSLGGLASLAGINIGSENSETEESLAVLRSQQFTESFIEDLHLMPKLFARKWDARVGAWRPGVKPPTLAQAYKYFKKSIRTILQDKKTGLVTVQIEWKDRHEAADWANVLVQRLNEEMRRRAISKTDASVGYLEKELDATSIIPTREAINRLIEAQIKQRMLAHVTQEYAFRVVDKALAPDDDDTVAPRKLLLVLAGPWVGAVVGVASVLFIAWFWSGIAVLRGAGDATKLP